MTSSNFSKYRPLYEKCDYPDNYADEYILNNLIINSISILY